MPDRACGENTVAEFSGLWDVSALLRRFIYAPGASTPFLVVERATGAKTFLHADRLGSIVATANANGAITGSAKYSPYGVTAGSIPTIFGYTGHQYDREIGIYYARARTYMPLLGRFMQVDPVGYKQSLNLYTYGMGNPMAGTDPSGGFFIGLGIAAVQFLAGEMTAAAFISTIIETAIWEGVTRGLDMLAPGAGQVLGIIRTVVGLATSAGFGGGTGKIVSVSVGTNAPQVEVESEYLGESENFASLDEAKTAAAADIASRSANDFTFKEHAAVFYESMWSDEVYYTLYRGGFGTVEFNIGLGAVGIMHSHPTMNAGSNILSAADMKSAAVAAIAAGTKPGELFGNVWLVHNNILYTFEQKWAAMGLSRLETSALDEGVVSNFFIAKFGPSVVAHTASTPIVP